ncbi:myosin heavy chain [Anaeramoeba flamelloides]|uniref:Myosin heavy chain n=1 Tax=Anaeramoeba flamelloides TaxID=1746091 RepID=A0ABQ8XXJ2_9EUKA|nr:myosin heavy chain [Anaeramoeba flamelloides]
MLENSSRLTVKSFNYTKTNNELINTFQTYETNLLYRNLFNNEFQGTINGDFQLSMKILEKTIKHFQELEKQQFELKKEYLKNQEKNQKLKQFGSKLVQKNELNEQCLVNCKKKINQKERVVEQKNESERSQQIEIQKLDQVCQKLENEIHTIKKSHQGLTLALEQTEVENEKLKTQLQEQLERDKDEELKQISQHLLDLEDEIDDKTKGIEELTQVNNYLSDCSINELTQEQKEEIFGLAVENVQNELENAQEAMEHTESEMNELNQQFEKLKNYNKKLTDYHLEKINKQELFDNEISQIMFVCKEHEFEEKIAILEDKEEEINNYREQYSVLLSKNRELKIKLNQIENHQPIQKTKRVALPRAIRIKKN